MIAPTDKDIGRAVNYVPQTASWIASTPEEGVITSFNDQYVFVRYGADKISKATRRLDLEWVRS